MVTLGISPKLRWPKLIHWRPHCVGIIQKIEFSPACTYGVSWTTGFQVPSGTHAIPLRNPPRNADAPALPSLPDNPQWLKSSGLPAHLWVKGCKSQQRYKHTRHASSSIHTIHAYPYHGKCTPTSWTSQFHESLGYIQLHNKTRNHWQ